MSDRLSEKPEIVERLATDNLGPALNCARKKSTVPLGYTPYGSDRHGTDKLLLRFHAQFRSLHSALYMLGNGWRSYSCTIMRFISPDSFSPFNEGGINAYAYCGGDPVNYHDQSGRSRLFSSLFSRKIKFNDDYQVLYPGSRDRAPSVFHKEVFKSGHAGFVTHGSAGKGPLLLNKRGELAPAGEVAKREIAPRLRGLPAYQQDRDKPVYLIACLAGESGAAQQVADVLGRPVIAYKHITSPPKRDFINLQLETHPSLGTRELPPIPHVERIATPKTFHPVRRIRGNGQGAGT